MRLDDPRHEEWREALRMHEREMERLRVEIARLERERGTVGIPLNCIRLQIELAHAELTRHHIDAALMATRLRCPAPD